MSKYGAMRYANKSMYILKNYNKGYTKNFQQNIKCTKHAIDRYRERMLKNGMPDADVEKRIVKMVLQSSLIGLIDGMEHRSCNGRIFVCKRELHDGVESLVVVTILMSETLQKGMAKGGIDKFVSQAEERKGHKRNKVL